MSLCGDKILFLHHIPSVHMHHFVFSFLLLLAFTTPGLTQKLAMEAKTEDLGKQIRVTVLFGSKRLAALPKPENTYLQYRVFTATDSANNLVQGSLTLERYAELTKQDTQYVCVFRFNKPNVGEAILQLVLSDLTAGQWTMQKLRVRGSSVKVQFGLENLSRRRPVPFATVGDSLVIRTDDARRMYMVRFGSTFGPSAPPWMQEGSSKDRELRVAAVIPVQSNVPFALSTPGLYFAQEDTTTNVGLGIFVSAMDFPKYKKVRHLAEPMVYLQNTREATALNTATERKPLIDNFWLQAGGSEEHAREMIKAYYQRVAFANEQFTAYKEGWKTDRGMIYVIFGPPDDQTIDGDFIQWHYFLASRGSRLTFEFQKRKNLFSDNDYELIRDPMYKQVWISMVEAWRKGMSK